MKAKASVRYLNDTNGKTIAVQVSVSEWKKLLNKIRKYEQVLQIKSDLTEALSEVKKSGKEILKSKLYQGF